MLEKQSKVLVEIFEFFNENKFDGKFTKKPVITIQSAGRKSALGWCSVKPIWSDNAEGTYYEINIAAEHLGSGVLEVAETVLHEMVHLSNIQDGINDCNPKSQYHNKNFKILAEEVGLAVEKSKKHGWAYTSLTDELSEEIKNAKFDNVFNIRRGVKVVEEADGGKSEDEDKPKTKKIFKYNCPECSIEIKSKISELEIVCKNCRVLFEEQD